MDRKKAAAAVVAMSAMTGQLSPIPADMDVLDVLRELSEIGGISLADPPEKIAKRAQQIENSRITYIAVNVSCDNDTMITMLCDIPEQRLTKEDEILSRSGYAFAYVYNNDAPFCSEYGDVVVEKRADGNLYRIG